jgi:hypothetical protein
MTIAVHVPANTMLADLDEALRRLLLRELRTTASTGPRWT